MAGRIERYKTSQHTYERQWVQFKDGRRQAVYRKDGKFTSARSFKSGRARAVYKEPISLTRDDDWKGLRGDEIEDRLQDEIAYTLPGTKIWVAGPDAGEYLPGLREGQKLQPDEITFLRQARGAERNFLSFWRNDITRDYEQARSDYLKFLDQISKVPYSDKARRRAILSQWGWNPGSA